VPDVGKISFLVSIDDIAEAKMIKKITVALLSVFSIIELKEEIALMENLQECAFIAEQ